MLRNQVNEPGGLVMVSSLCQRKEYPERKGRLVCCVFDALAVLALGESIPKSGKRYSRLLPRKVPVIGSKSWTEISTESRARVCQPA
jgi:hypothetical protein